MPLSLYQQWCFLKRTLLSSRPNLSKKAKTIRNVKCTQFSRGIGRRIDLEDEIHKNELVEGDNDGVANMRENVRFHKTIDQTWSTNSQILVHNQTQNEDNVNPNVDHVEYMSFQGI